MSFLSQIIALGFEPFGEKNQYPAAIGYGTAGKNKVIKKIRLCIRFHF
jgi:hypothetical protein